MSSKAEILKFALEQAARIGINIYSTNQFENDAKKTGVLLFSDTCYIKRNGKFGWAEGRIAVTSNVIIVRAHYELFASISHEKISEKLNIPSKSFSFKNSDFYTLGFKSAGISFRDSSILFDMTSFNRQKFTDAIGASRRYAN